MTKFIDGPASGQVLMLHRAAVFLRVTEENGKFDALDQLWDSPRPTETLYAYTIVGQPGMAFIDGTKCRGCYAIAQYRFADPQPTDAQMRDNQAWHEWCLANKPMK